jgi:hypothetical protein
MRDECRHRIKTQSDRGMTAFRVEFRHGRLADRE